MIIDEGSVLRNALCAQYNGVDEYAYRDAPSFASDTQGWISFWYRPDTVLASNTVRNILGLIDTSSASRHLTVNLRRSAAVGSVSRIEIFPRNTNSAIYTCYAATTTVIAATTWYHVVIRCSGGAYAIWINGISQAINPWFAEGGGQSPLWFGGMTGIASPRIVLGRGNTTYGDCRLDEILIGDHAISGTEVAWLYNAGVPRNPHKADFAAHIRHWYRGGDSRDNGTTMYDEIGSDHLALNLMDATNYVDR